MCSCKGISCLFCFPFCKGISFRFHFSEASISLSNVWFGNEVPSSSRITTRINNCKQLILPMDMGNDSRYVTFDFFIITLAHDVFHHFDAFNSNAEAIFHQLSLLIFNTIALEKQLTIFQAFLLLSTLG